MEKRKKICDSCMFSSAFACVDHGHVIELDKDKKYESKLYDLLKERVSCGRLMEENSIYESCRFFKKSKNGEE